MASHQIIADRRQLVRHAALGITLLPIAGTCHGKGESLFTPEDFGAKGDGRANDTAALRRLAAAVNAAGGGTIAFRRTTYLVGAQVIGAPDDLPWWAAPSDILHFKGCVRSLTLQGNGATLRCEAGLRYGVFDPVSRTRWNRPMPNLDPKGRATPYAQMILIEGCAGDVSISDLELDGNCDRAIIGGQYGDIGWQLPATGLSLLNNTGNETVRNVHAHHHLLDGLIISRQQTGPHSVKLLERVRAEHNGRQGCSLVAGQGYLFSSCVFASNGRGRVASPPKAGVDLEAEVGPIRGVSFVNCRFVDNGGAGMVADSGDTARVKFSGCTFVGTTNWAVWPNKPFFSFAGCTFVGQICRCFSGDDAGAATHFSKCVFTDDPRLSPTGKVLADGPIADLSTGNNVRFDHCSFIVGHGAALPWSTGAIYANCTMRQTRGPRGFPRGTYLGATTIVGDVDLAYSHIKGSVMINGVRYP